MNIRIWLLTVFFCLSLSITAQDYQWGVGVRLGPSAGITAKYSLSSYTYIDGILHFRWHGASITGLYEIHAPAFDVNDLFWYYGGGAHAGYWEETHNHPFYHDFESHALIGVDGIIGLEYYIRDIPFTIGLDYKPSLNFFDYFGFFYDELGVTIRYVF
ncbi:MAG: hypothetical protein JXB49_35955 [Bacteroidales bacterium]|nr:hypothetical protein [Bacteroidales bacterium]